ncbi:hypothetical protein PVL29_013240 [Vitis rotundifolia]|uniref:TOD1/MUCI70 glycosyltransferase-like domain-containing protein n=1 Tax=Vitis rotundifolia TaxID=103349 RepID=A0AA39DQY3_VITRO|nr:hypothetical protein PVL29_013240 [Vitis rotundifolia]
MGKASLTTPLLFQSKRLCFSVLYLFTTLFLAIYVSLSPTKCIFRSSPFDPIQAPLFSYPPNYGEHKYAISTVRSSCTSPVHFSDYWMVLKKIQDSCRNSTMFLPGLRYIQGNADTFGGNLSTQKRISYFDHRDDGKEVPCGFMKEFSISKSDRIAMEKCGGVVVVSAIFADHDKIRQPKGLGSRTLENVCFFMFVDDTTLKGLDYHKVISTESQEYKVGAWRLVRVSSQHLYKNPAMNGVIPKYLVHRLFPNSKYSIWVDAKLQLVVDPLLLIHSLVISENVDMAISKHPFFMEEVGDIESLKLQMETYCGLGLKPWTQDKLPYTSDVPDSALILRKHGMRSNLFSCLLFNELEAFNPRDQLAFAYVRDKMRPKVKMNMFEVEVFEHIAVEFRHNLKHSGTKLPQSSKTKRASPDLFANGTCSMCDSYLLEMWGEPRN